MPFFNPIITGFSADPSVCRVGKDYYLVNSSFAYMPAIPIYHSQDLVNWEQVGNALLELPEIDNYNLDINGGVWAPTIRYNKGTFFICAAVEKVGNLIIHSMDVAGKWSKPIWIKSGGIDPSLYFEDDRAYFCTNDWTVLNPGIQLGEIDPFTGEVLSDFKCIYEGAGGGWLEAPHVYHYGEWYYLLAAEGGTYTGHMEIAARAKALYGPYEDCPYNPILTNRNDVTKEVSCTGHGDLVTDNKGNIFMIHLGCRPGLLGISPLGRETFLSVIKMVEGWPIVDGKMAGIYMDYPAFNGVIQSEKVFYDDFKSVEWPLQWQFLRGKGREYLERKVDGLHSHGKSFAFIRQIDIDFEFEVTVENINLQEDEKAGVLIFLSEDFWGFWGITKKDEDYYICLIQRADNLKQKLFSDKISSKDFPITINVSGNRNKYNFKCDALGCDNVPEISTRFFSPMILQRSFTGTMNGIGIWAEHDNSFANFNNLKVKSIRKKIADTRENKK